jgi:CBS domain-containing protein
VGFGADPLLQGLVSVGVDSRATSDAHVGSVPKRLGLLVARTSRILNARSLDELVGETAEAARRVLRAARAVAFVQPDGGAELCSGHSPRRDPADVVEPTRAVPLVGRDGTRLGALQVWARDGSSLSWEDEQILQQIAHCAATVADGSLARRPGVEETTVATRLARTVHDLRTPLTAILSWAWALAHGLEGERAARALEAIERNARAQARLLDEAAASVRTALRAEGDEPRTTLPPPDGRRVRDVMTRAVETVAPGDTLRFVAARMQALDVGALPVCDGDRLVGLVTDRDIALRAVAQGRDPNRTAAVEAMTGDLVIASETQSIADAVSLMRRHGVRRLPVADAERRLVGIVALADLALRDSEHAAGEVLSGISGRPSD